MENPNSSSPPTSPNPFSDLDTNTFNRYLNLSDPSNPFRLDHGDSPAITLVSDLLTTDNYETWSRAMRRALRAKNKLGFITGSLLKPTDPSDPLLETWERCNDMIVSWIQNSVSSSIKSSVVFVDDAKEIWMDLHDRFSQQNGPRIFQLQKALAGLLQEHDSVSVYYGKLKTLWDELSIYDPLPVCNCGTMKVLLDRYQRTCVIQFLMGLHESYFPVRDQIMLLDPLPPLTKVFSLIQQQERHHLMTTNIPSSETMALATRKFYPTSKPTPKPNLHSKRERPFCTHCKINGHSVENCFKLGNAEVPVCTHCNMSGHTVERCYKLLGYPPGHKFYSKPQTSGVLANQATLSIDSDLDGASDERVGLTKLQYQQLIALLQPKEIPLAATALNSSSHSPSSLLPPSSSKMSGSSFCLSSHSHTSFSNWILDTGATDHMVYYWEPL